jgi:hypothetical protein
MWTDVSSGLPEDNGSVLCYVTNDQHKSQHFEIGWLDDNRWVDQASRDIEIYAYKVTHWMPLPEAPK